MGLYDDLIACREAAQKNHDSVTRDSVQNVIAAIKTEQINRGVPLTQEDEQTVLTRQVKQLTDALHDFTTAGRVDLIDKTKAEIKLLSGFLPEQLSDDELRLIVSEVIMELGVVTERDLGRAIGLVMPKVKGRADGVRVRSMISQLVTGS